MPSALIVAALGYSLRVPTALVTSHAGRASTIVASESVSRRQATQLAATAFTTSVILTPEAANAAYPQVVIKTTVSHHCKSSSAAVFGC